MDERLIRGALRLSAEYLLRNVEIMADLAEGDFMLGLIFVAIVQANVRHVTDDPELGKKYGLIGTVPPDELRQPISINALSESLNIPYETTRRYVHRLIDQQRCVKVGSRGVVVPGAILALPEAAEAGFKQYSHLMHFLRQLKEIGITAN